MKFRNSWFALFQLLALGTSAALLASADSLSALASTADAIIVGSTSSRIETDTTEQFDLKILRALTGALHSGETITVTWARPAGGLGGKIRTGTVPGTAATINLQSMGMWFLQHAGGTWTAIRARGGPPFFTCLFYPAAPDGPAPTLASLADTASAHLLSEVAAGVETPPAPPFLHFAALLDALGSEDSPSIRSILLHVLNSQASSRDRADAIEGLMDRGDIRGIQYVARDPTLASFADASGQVVSAVRNSFRSADPAAVAILIKLASASPTSNDLAAAATRALSSIHSRETLPFLAGLLSSEDPELRARGMVGLSAFVNGCPMQTLDNVKSMDYLNPRLPSTLRNADTLEHLVIKRGAPENEPEFLTFWTNWWAEHKQDFAGLAAQ